MALLPHAGAFVCVVQGHPQCWLLWHLTSLRHKLGHKSLNSPESQLGPGSGLQGGNLSFLPAALGTVPATATSNYSEPDNELMAK